MNLTERVGSYPAEDVVLLPLEARRGREAHKSLVLGQGQQHAEVDGDGDERLVAVHAAVHEHLRHEAAQHRTTNQGETRGGRGDEGRGDEGVQT